MGPVRVAMAIAVIVATAVGAGNAPAAVGVKAVRPEAGFFQTDLTDGGTFSIVLVVGVANGKKIDLVDVVCAPEGTLDVRQAFTIDTNVKIRDGRFHLESDQVEASGRFTSPTRAKGTIKAFPRSRAEVAACGIPKKATWSSQCTLGIRRLPPADDEGGVVLTSAIGTGNNGTTIVHYSKGRFETVDPTGACAENAPAPPLTPEEQAYLDALGPTRGNFESDQEAIRAGQDVCTQVRAGSYSLDLVDPNAFDVFVAAVKTLCPEYSNLVQEFPNP